MRLNKTQAAAVRSWIAEYHSGGSSGSRANGDSACTEDAQMLLCSAADEQQEAAMTPKRRHSSAVALHAMEAAVAGT